MSEESLKQSLIKLRESLNTADTIDEETLSLAQNLEMDIKKLLEPEEENPIDSPVDLALSLESRFETEHPTAAGIVRELINALHKMGI